MPRRSENVQRSFLMDTDRYWYSKGPAKRHGLAVVISMHMSNEDPAYVTKAATQCAQCTLKSLTRLRQRPTRINEYQSVHFHDGVDIDRPKSVIRKGQRNAMNSRCNFKYTWFSPVMAVWFRSIRCHSPTPLTV